MDDMNVATKIFSPIDTNISHWGKILPTGWPKFCFRPVAKFSISIVKILKAEMSILLTVWPDLAIYWTLGKFLKPLATIKLPKYPSFLGSFCKGVKIIHFSNEIIFGQLLQTFGDFYLVTLFTNVNTACLSTIIYQSASFPWWCRWI